MGGRAWRACVALSVALIAAAGGGCAAAVGATPLRTARAGGTTFHTIAVGGRTRSFLLHLPPASDGRRVPLVLVLHGHAGSANVAMESTRMNEAADRAGVAVAYPNGSGALRYVGLSWNARTCCGHAQRHRVDDVAFLDTLVRTLVAAGLADSTRVFATGFSAGGMLALRLACERPRTFAGVADVAGAMPDTTCAAGRAVRVLLVQGAEDDELRLDLRALRRRRGHRFARSLEDALGFWARRAGCVGADGRVLARRDSTAAYTRLRAASCPPGLAVELYTVPGHPHAWPGGRRTWWRAPRPARVLDASRLVLAFFGVDGGAAAAGEH